MIDRNNDDLRGMWTRLYRQRGRLAPLLGTYTKASPATGLSRTPTSLVVKDMKSSRIDADGLVLPEVCVPDISFLRRRGICLPTETETLMSQRLVPNTRTAEESNYLRWLGLSVKDKKQKITVKFESDIEFPSEDSFQNQLAMEAIKIPKRLVRKKRSDIFDRIATRRQLEKRILHSMLHNFYKTMQRTIANARPSEHMTCKNIFDALDEDNRKLADEMRIGRHPELDAESRMAIFDEWKTKMLKLVDMQGEKDLKVAKDARHVGRTKLPKMSMFRSKRHAVESLQSIHADKSIKTENFDWI